MVEVEMVRTIRVASLSPPHDGTATVAAGHPVAGYDLHPDGRPDAATPRLRLSSHVPKVYAYFVRIWKPESRV
jgi:hypothetical protein